MNLIFRNLDMQQKLCGGQIYSNRFPDSYQSTMILPPDATRRSNDIDSEIVRQTVTIRRVAHGREHAR
jgi:hypothetical protein